MFYICGRSRIRTCMLLPAGTCTSLCLSIGYCTFAQFHHPTYELICYVIKTIFLCNMNKLLFNKVIN
jgi:hypothetical protein